MEKAAHQPNGGQYMESQCYEVAWTVWQILVDNVGESPPPPVILVSHKIKLRVCIETKPL